MRALEKKLSGLTGKRRYAAAFGLGTLMTLSLPPVGAFYLQLLCVPGFIWLARAAKKKREAFLTGWAFGAGYFILGLYWISFALFVDIANFWWVVPFSAIVGPGVFALYYALIPLAAWRWRGSDTSYALITVVAWALIEWVRGHAFTGFPWNLPGYTWHMIAPLMQVNAVFGIYGLTLLTLLWAAVPALRRSVAVPLLMIFTLAAFGGMARLHALPTVESRYAVRVVQPNIAQSLKWDPEAARRNFRAQLDLTDAPSPLKTPPTFVVWPETGVTVDMERNPEVAEALRARLPHRGIALVGNLRAPKEQFYNSLAALDNRERILGFYDKHHLVPFGEYIPYRNILNMTPIAAGISIIGDFTPGDGPATMYLGSGLPRPSPLICYEVIFPGAVARRDDRPGWLVNVTNDAWYGHTAGPHQHFEIARVRAVEEGLPLVRAANTGISAIIDPLGRVLAMKELGDTGVVDAMLPKPLPPTPYTKTGDAPFFMMLALAALIAEMARRRK